jgi:hypothetical protein
MNVMIWRSKKGMVIFMRKKLEALVERCRVAFPELVKESSATNKSKSKVLSNVKISVMTLQEYEAVSAIRHTSFVWKILALIILKLCPNCMQTLENIPMLYNGIDNEILFNVDTFEKFNIDPDIITMTAIKHEIGHALDHASSPIMYYTLLIFSMIERLHHMEKFSTMTKETFHEVMETYYNFTTERRANKFFNLTYKDLI